MTAPNQRFFLGKFSDMEWQDIRFPFEHQPDARALPGYIHLRNRLWDFDFDCWTQENILGLDVQN